MALEKYMAIAGLALSIFFVAEVLTLFNFMIDPADNDSFGFEAAPKLFQFISLSIAPAGIMMGVSFYLSKRYGSRFNGMLIILSGVIVLVGMLYANTMLEDLKPELVDFATTLSFLVAPIIAILNHKLVVGRFLPENTRPSIWVKGLSICGIIFLTGFALFFIYTKFF